MRKSNLILLLFLLCYSSSAESKAYQYYRPINDTNAEEFIQRALKELTFFGDFAIPVKEIHLRHSKRRSEPRLYSRADIKDWSLLDRKLNKFLQKDSTKNIDLDRKKQQSTIKYLNSLIKDEKLIKNTPFSQLTLNDQQKKWAGKGFFGFFSEDSIKLNRSLLDTLLSDSVNSFKFIKRPPTGMQLCELANKERGIFIIYLRHPADTDAFYCELAHELFHTLDPTIYDWNMEGLANVFAENILEKTGKSWNHFNTILSDRSKPYGASYHMIKDFHDVYPKALKGIVRFKYELDKKKSGIDTTKWLKALPNKQQNLYKSLLKQHLPILKANQQNYIKIN